MRGVRSVFRVDGFLSSDECRHIMRLATPALRPSILHSMGHPQQVQGGTIADCFSGVFCCNSGSKATVRTARPRTAETPR